MTRIDKWLWAARFFRTRAKAKQAIEGGKVHIAGIRAKASKELKVHDILTVRQGFDQKTVKVLVLSDRRGSAPVAALLYEEFADSIAKRNEALLQRQALAGSEVRRAGRPSKKDRREIHRFRDRQD